MRIFFHCLSRRAFTSVFFFAYAWRSPGLTREIHLISELINSLILACSWLYPSGLEEIPRERIKFDKCFAQIADVRNFEERRGKREGERNICAGRVFISYDTMIPPRIQLCRLGNAWQLTKNAPFVKVVPYFKFKLPKYEMRVPNLCVCTVRTPVLSLTIITPMWRTIAYVCVFTREGENIFCVCSDARRGSSHERRAPLGEKADWFSDRWSLRIIEQEWLSCFSLLLTL